MLLAKLCSIENDNITYIGDSVIGIFVDNSSNYTNWEFLHGALIRICFQWQLVIVHVHMQDPNNLKQTLILKLQNIDAKKTHFQTYVRYSSYSNYIFVHYYNDYFNNNLNIVH